MYSHLTSENVVKVLWSVFATPTWAFLSLCRTDRLQVLVGIFFIKFEFLHHIHIYRTIIEPRERWCTTGFHATEQNQSNRCNHTVDCGYTGTEKKKGVLQKIQCGHPIIGSFIFFSDNIMSKEIFIHYNVYKIHFN